MYAKCTKWQWFAGFGIDKENFTVQYECLPIRECLGDVLLEVLHLYCINQSIKFL